MLLKPINPSPIHKAIDSSVDNELSCEVLNNEIVGSQFYVWDENGDLVHQERGTLTDNGLSYTLPANTIKNGKDYSWDTTYWGDVDSYLNTVQIKRKASQGVASIEVGSNTYLNGSYFNPAGYYSHGFYRMNDYDATTFHGIILYDTHEEANDAKTALDNKYAVGDVIQFYDANQAIVKELKTKGLTTSVTGSGLYCYVKIENLQFRANPWITKVESFSMGEVVSGIGAGNYVFLTDDFNNAVPHRITGFEQSSDGYTTTIYLSTPTETTISDTDRAYLIDGASLLYNTSPEYYFRARQTPSFSFNNLEEHTNEDGLTKLTNHFHNFNIKYSCESVNLLNPSDIGDISIIISGLKKNTSYVLNFEAAYIVGFVDDDAEDYEQVDYTIKDGNTYISAENMKYTKLGINYGAELDTSEFMIVEGDTLPATFVPYNITPTPLGEYQIVVSALDERNKYTEVYKTDIIHNPVLENSKINFTYDGFVSGNIYSVEIYGKTIEGDIVNKCEAVFAVEYSTNYSQDISVQSKKGYVDIFIENPWDINDGNYLIVLRQDNKSLSLQKVCEIPLRSMNALGGTKNNIRDYNVASKNTYTYYFAVKNNDGYITECDLLKSNTVNVNYDQWFVIGLEEDNEHGFNVDEGNIWSFELNASGSVVSSYKHNYNKSTYDNFDRYASLSIGRKNYVDFTLNCFIGDVNCDGEYYDDIDMVNEWVDFCHSSCVKLYKDPKGRIMLVDATSMESSHEIMSSEDPTTINASFKQIGDTYNVPIYTWGLI